MLEVKCVIFGYIICKCMDFEFFMFYEYRSDMCLAVINSILIIY